MQPEIAATFQNLETSSDFIRAYWGGSELCVKVQQIVISAVTACGPREALGTKTSIKHDICL